MIHSTDVSQDNEQYNMGPEIWWPTHHKTGLQRSGQ